MKLKGEGEEKWRFYLLIPVVRMLGNERIDKDEKRIAREERWEIIH